jgi:hypothetical protein
VLPSKPVSFDVDVRRGTLGLRYRELVVETRGFAGEVVQLRAMGIADPPFDDWSR